METTPPVRNTGMKFYVAHFSKEAPNYTVTFPDVPEATVRGRDLAEALFLAEDVLRETLENYSKTGRIHPSPSSHLEAQQKIANWKDGDFLQLIPFAPSRRVPLQETDLRLSASQLKELKSMAGYVWWESPEQVLKHPDKLLAQIMDRGTLEDLLQMEKIVSREVLVYVLTNATAGQFCEMSWNFWHYRLTDVLPGQVPPLPCRKDFPLPNGWQKSP